MAKVQGAVHVGISHGSEMLGGRVLGIRCRSILVENTRFGPLSLVFLL